MNYEIKSPTEGEEYQIDTLRANLLSCPNINPNCEAMQVALAALDESKRIIDMQATLARTISQSGAATKKETRNMTLSPSITSVSTTSTNSYLSPMQRSPQQKQYTTPYTESTSPINVNNHNQKVNETIKIEKIKINENKNPNENENKKTSNIFKIFRSILIDLPLVTCFLLTILTVSLSHIYDEYLSPQLAQFKYDDTNRRNDLTYYHRVCPLGQMSTTKAEDLYINDDFTTDDAAEHMMVHGMSVYKDLIQPETAQTLRKYIVERNQNLKGKEAISVIHNENRWSFGIGANDHPSVAKALNEIATNSVFRPALEKIAGDDPALIEMTAITAGYGATDQFWHPDVVSAGSSAKYARNFAPSYSLFVTLQDTTGEMGATGICPGTYMCGNEDAMDTCENHGIQVSGEKNLWKAGHGMFVNQQSFHRGAAHIDPDAPHRVVFIITFSPRPMERGETRMMGKGGSYSLRWDMWGHTLKDLENAPTAMTQPWTTLRALGMYKPKDANWGYDFLSQHSMRCATLDTGYEDPNDFIDMVTIPKLLLPVFDNEKMTYDDFFKACVLKWKKWAAFVNIAAIVTYLCSFLLVGIVALIFNNKVSQRIFSGIFCSTIRITMLYMVVASLTYYVIQDSVVGSIWAKEIKNGTFKYSPFVVTDKIDSVMQREKIVIGISDVLITDRLNAKQLNSVTTIPNYHPGNMKLSSEMKGAIDTFRFLRVEDKTALARTIVDNTIFGESNFVVLNDNSDWVPLTMTEAEDYVAHYLYLKENPLLASLDREANFLLSFYRYGYLKPSVMARKHSPTYINTLVDNIFTKDGISSFKLFRSTDAMNAKQSSRLFATKVARKSLSPFILRSGCFHQKLSDSLPNPRRQHMDRIPTALRSQFHNKINATQQMLRVGDIIEGQYNGQHNEWYKGKILNIHEGSIIDVEYIDGELDYELDTSNVARFREYTVGEGIEVINAMGDWVEAKIMRKHSNNKFSVRPSRGRRELTVDETKMRRYY